MLIEQGGAIFYPITDLHFMNNQLCTSICIVLCTTMIKIRRERRIIRCDSFLWDNDDDRFIEM